MKQCSRPECDHPLTSSHRYCRCCQAAYVREWRKTHPPSETERRHAITRSYTGVLIRRGHLKRQPCQECGAKAEAHHPDYRDPRWVVWLCRRHHRELHASIRRLLDPRATRVEE